MSMSSKSDLRVSPHNLEAEIGVLGSILLMNEAIDEIGDVLRADHFYSEANQKLYAAILGLYGSGVRGIDGITLADELARRSELETIGGFAYLHDILGAVPHAAHVRYYANIVQERWRRRTLILACTETLANCYDETTDTAETIGQAEKLLSQIAEDSIQHAAIPIREFSADAVFRIKERRAERTRGATASGIMTGFRDLDAITTGFQASELTILAARPAMGKTAFAIRVAESIARSGRGVLLFSLEQRPTELAERMLAQVAVVNAHAIREGSISDDDSRKIESADKQFSDLPLWIDSAPERSIGEIVTITRREHRKRGIAIMFVDYLQLIEPHDKKALREQQVAGISRSLKVLARELGIPVVALAQLNRGVESRDNKRPKLSDLRESGAIEQDADVVMFLHRPDAYNFEDRPGEAEIVIAKNRSGPAGIVDLTWRKDFMRFEDRSNQPDTEWVGTSFK